MDYNFIGILLLGFLEVALPMPQNVSNDPPPGHHTKTTTSTTSDTITESLRSKNARVSGAGARAGGTSNGTKSRAGGAGVANATATTSGSGKVKVGQSGGMPDKKGVSGRGTSNQTQTSELNNTVGQGTEAGSTGRPAQTEVGTVSKDIIMGAGGQQTSENEVKTSTQRTVEQTTERAQADHTARGVAGRNETDLISKDPNADGVKDIASQVNESGRFRSKLFGRGARRKMNNESSDTAGGWSFL